MGQIIHQSAFEQWHKIVSSRQHIGDGSDSDKARLRNDFRWRLQEFRLLKRSDLSLLHNLILSVEGEVDGGTAEECDEGDGSVYVIAYGFEQFGALGLNNLRFLLIAHVQSQSYELLGVRCHLLNLRLGGLHH